MRLGAGVLSCCSMNDFCWFSCFHYVLFHDLIMLMVSKLAMIVLLCWNHDILLVGIDIMKWFLFLFPIIFIVIVYDYMLLWVIECIKMMIFGIFLIQIRHILFWCCYVCYGSLSEVTGSLLLTWFTRSSLELAKWTWLHWEKCLILVFSHNSRTVNRNEAQSKELERYFKALIDIEVETWCYAIEW